MNGIRVEQDAKAVPWWSLRRGLPGARSTRLRCSRAPSVEPLERKSLMAVSITPVGTWVPGVIPTASELRIESDNASDTVFVYPVVDPVVNPTASPAVVSVFSVNENFGVLVFRGYYNVLRPNYTTGTVSFYGNGGNDVFVNNTNLITTADGGRGNDILRGGSNNDTLVSGWGDNDILEGRGGNDTLYAVFSTAKLYGGEGDDTLVGIYSVNSILDGGAGHDTLYLTRYTNINVTMLGGTGTDDFWIDGSWSFYPLPSTFTTPDRVVATEPLHFNFGP